jgi:ketosteroid isomerase-like protein
MKIVKWVEILGVVFMLAFPFALQAQTQPAMPAAEVIPEAEIRAFIERYVDCYKALDINAYMALFSKEAVENRMLAYADIEALYERTFKMTNQFVYHLYVQAIQPYTKSAFVCGRYEIIQTLKADNEMRAYRGNIQWDLVREDGSLKIRRINFGRDIEEKKFWKNL